MDIHALSLSDVTRRVKSGELTARAVADAMLARIERLQPDLGAYVTVLADRAREQAEALDARRERGEALGLLHGAPIALKDLLYTKGIPTSCGTTILADWCPEEDATIVARLEAAGAIVLGKVKLTEGAYGQHHPAVEPPKNPWNPERWTGVSSSGSGVAVAAGLAHGAIGTDTGGSIRFPSAACGLVGIKPSYGRVSRHGAFPLADSLDHVGPMTRSVEDAARMLQVMAGHDPKDATSLRAPVPTYAAAFRRAARRLKDRRRLALCRRSRACVCSRHGARCVRPVGRLGRCNSRGPSPRHRKPGRWLGNYLRRRLRARPCRDIPVAKGRIRAGVGGLDRRRLAGNARRLCALGRGTGGIPDRARSRLGRRRRHDRPLHDRTDSAGGASCSRAAPARVAKIAP